MKRRRNGRPVPLAPPPMMRSRKRARVVTTLFHKHTEKRDAALRAGDVHAAQHFEQMIEDMGGRAEYQRASQLNTSLHSTSRWVIGSLRRMGWLHGDSAHTLMPTAEDDGQGKAKNPEEEATSESSDELKGPVGQISLLEVGAINTELIRASEKAHCKLSVRAIDLRPTDDKIEKYDFFNLPWRNSDPTKRYHVVVCSMVINCVTTPLDRGRMLLLLFSHLRPGGLCFLTLPLRCLTESKYMTREMFLDLLSGPGVEGIGFDLVDSKETPKLAFFILRRPKVLNAGSNLPCSLGKQNQEDLQECAKSVEEVLLNCEESNSGKKTNKSASNGKSVRLLASASTDKVPRQEQMTSYARTTNKWTKVVTVAKGKKFKNTFAVVLSRAEMQRT